MDIWKLVRSHGNCLMLMLLTCTAERSQKRRENGWRWGSTRSLDTKHTRNRKEKDWAGPQGAWESRKYSQAVVAAWSSCWSALEGKQQEKTNTVQKVRGRPPSLPLNLPPSLSLPAAQPSPWDPLPNSLWRPVTPPAVVRKIYLLKVQPVLKVQMVSSILFIWNRMSMVH